MTAAPARESDEAMPGVLFDRLEFGLHAKGEGFGGRPVAQLTESLRLRGLLRSRPKSGRLPIGVPLNQPGGDAAQAEGELWVSGADEGALILKNASVLGMNLMRVLRHTPGVTVCEELGLDGKDNFVGPTEHRAAALLPLQLDFVRQVISAIVEGVNNIAVEGESGFSEQVLWISEAEVGLDVPFEDARSVVRSLWCAALPGAVRVKADLYRASAECEDGVPVVRWWRTKLGYCVKVYAKAPNLVRCEVACRDREAIASLRQRVDAEVDPEDAVRLLLGFARAAEPILRETVAHVRAAAESVVLPADALVALFPLMMLAAGHSCGAGRPPETESSAAAKEALGALITHGCFHARNLRLETAVRRVLEDLSEPGGPLIREGRGANYSLRPALGSAMCALAAPTVFSAT